MAKNEPKSLFRKLTKLFRSGPVVKRKIRALDTTMAVADKTKSSGTLLFQKSLSPTYATITSNAYNLSERLMRYQDFQEMEYTPEIASALDIYCLTKEAMVSTPCGDYTIDQLHQMNGVMMLKGYDDSDTGKFPIYCYDSNNKRITIGQAHSIRKTGTQVHVVKVTFDDGNSIRCTPNHRFMLRDGTYRMASDLVKGSSLMPFTVKWMGRKGHEYPYVYTMDRAKTKSGWRAQHLFNVENLVRPLGPGEVVHHKDFDRANHGIDNLEIMGELEHSQYHARLNNRNKLGKPNAKHSAWMLENNPTALPEPSLDEMIVHRQASLPEFMQTFGATYATVRTWLRKHGYENWGAFQADKRTTGSQSMKVGVNALSVDVIRNAYVSGDSKTLVAMKLGCTLNVLDKFINRKLKTTWSDLVVGFGGSRLGNGGRPKGSYTSDVTYQQICDSVIPGTYVTQKDLADSLGVSISVIQLRLQEQGFSTFSAWADSYHNHKVVSVEPDGVDDVYDMTVDSHHNFACNGVIVHNSDETVAADDKGRCLHVYSDNEKIKETLEDLMYNTLNVEFNLRSWARNLPVHKDTVIPLLDGRNVTIEQLAKEHDAGKQNWVYSVQDKTLRTVPGRVAWCGLTRKDAELVRVWLDDETYVDCTPDHEWVMRDGTQKRADTLVEGDSMMPFYRKLSSREEGAVMQGYERVYDAATGAYVYTHRRVAEVLEEGMLKDGRWLVTHHSDFDKRNNDPANLVRMDEKEHMELHRQHALDVLHSPEVTAKRMVGIDRWLRSDDHRELAKEQLKTLQAKGLMKTSWADYNASPQAKQDNVKRSHLKKEMWKDAVRRSRAQATMTIKFDQRCLDLVIERLEAHGKYVSPKVLGAELKSDETFMGHFRDINKGAKRDLTKALNSHNGFENLLVKAGVPSYLALVKDRVPAIASTPWFKRAEKKSAKMKGIVPTMCVQRLNHKVVRVEQLVQTSDVYCMEVLGAAGEHDRHNFMVITASETVDKQGVTSGICSANCKYGDFFLYNDVSPEFGVVNAFPIPVNEIEREENYDREDPFAVRYRWVTLGNRTLENWEVTHFRLLGNDMFLPYGSSVIEPARRIWRQLILIEDAMLVYRVVRAPERRVFYIDVANIPPENVPMYVEEQKRNLRTNQVIDRNSGRVDLRYNPLPTRYDTPVPLLDGTTLTIEELSRKMSADPMWTPWVYSVQDKTQRVVPGKVVWCGKNYTATRLSKVWLDDGSYVTTAPEHPFVMRDGSARRADQLMPGDSIMSAYRDLNNKGYERIIEPSGGRVSTHVMVARDAHSEKWSSTDQRVVHHKHPELGAQNKRNNVPDNLEVMNFWEHRKMHAEHCELTLNTPERLAARAVQMKEYNKTPEHSIRTSEVNRRDRKAQRMGEAYNGTDLHRSHNENRRLGQRKSWDESKRSRSEAMRWIVPNEVVQFVFAAIKADPSVGREELSNAIRRDASLHSALKLVNAHNERSVDRFHVNAVISKLARSGLLADTSYGRFREYALSSPAPVNHQVVRVEMLDNVADDVYCMTVVGPCGEDDRHNFAVNGLGTETISNQLRSLVFVWNSVDEDYFIPVRGNDTGTRIDTLQGGQNTAAVEDVAYIQKKLFAALKIPRAYLGYDDMLSCVISTTCVPLLDGTVMTIGDLASRDWSSPEAKPVYAYSCDPSTGQFKPGRIVKAWKTKDVDTLYRIALDNGHVIKCTDNHPFLCRDGAYKRADELQPGQSLMPLYRRFSATKKHAGSDKLDGYEMLLDNSTNEWTYTHGLVDRHACKKTIDKCRVIHHVDCNKLNNAPENLQEMTWYTHRKWHAAHASQTLQRPDVIAKRYPKVVAWLKSARHRAFASDLMKQQTRDPEHGIFKWIHGDKISGTMSRVMEENWQDPEYRRVKTAQSKALWEDEAYRSRYLGDNHWSRKANVQHDIDWLRKFCVDNCVTSVQQWRSDYQRSVSHLSPVGMRYVKNLIKREGFKSWKGFKETISYNHKVVSVDVVRLTEPVPVYDLEVEGWHNFVVVPNGDMTWSSGVTVHNSKATLAQEDIRFSRSINVIQKTIIAELNKLAIIHLFAHGFDGDDLQNFTLRLSNPSTVAQQQKLELWRTKFEIGSSIPEGMTSREFVQREVWGLNDDDIDNINDQRMKERVFDAALDNAEPEGEAGAGGGGDLFGGPGGEPEGGEGAAGGAAGDEDGESGGDKEKAPPEENAAEEPREDDDDAAPEIQLLTSSDSAVDLGDDDGFAPKLDDHDDRPVKVSKHIKDTLYNRSRRRHHGSSVTHMPDLNKMTGNDSTSMDDPYDNDWLKSVSTNPLGERRLAGAVSSVSRRLGLSPDVVSTLRRMAGKLGFSPGAASASPTVLTESDREAGQDVQADIDARSSGDPAAHVPNGDRALRELSTVFGDNEDDSQLFIGDDDDDSNG